MADQHYRAFGTLFFLLHQKKLLWLLNAPVVGRWFRRVLRISGESSAVGRARISRILPHAIFWWQGDKQVAEFRTHAKFSKRLYYAFAPLWWALHAWDWSIADRWIPELSFGFDTLTAYPDFDPESTTVDGEVGADHGTGTRSWATLKGEAGNDSTDNATEGAAVVIISDSGSTYWTSLYRGITLFDTSALTASATISGATKSLYGSSKADALSITPNINIYASNPASSAALTGTDFSTLGAVAFCDTPIAYAGWNTAGYNDFAFNAAGIAAISKTGVTKTGTRNATFDVGASTPTWSASKTSELRCYYADQTGTANDPKLVVTYSLIVNTVFDQSPIIKGLTFGSLSRLPAAIGSDLWRPVESDDGHLYSFFGDGGGFGGSNTVGRVQWGFARIEGNYASRAGYNVCGGVDPEQATPPIDSVYGGSGNLKATDQISYGGVIYALMSEWGNPPHWYRKFIKTEDKGATWKQSNGATLDNTTWDYTDAINPTFNVTWIQIGADYGDMTDGYVYGFRIGSPGLYSCRVAIADIMDPDSYTYRKSDGTWNSDFSLAESMFNYVPCDFLQAWYHPGLHRYFITFGPINEGDPAQLLMLDAPNPWGPWTKVGAWNPFIDSNYKFSFTAPSKWNSGADFVLVFSGVDDADGEGTYDNFCTVPGTFKMAVISGTATESITEADIKAGGKTIVITLGGDTWISN